MNTPRTQPRWAMGVFVAVLVGVAAALAVGSPQAQGNTATGPGSLGIRKTLSPAGQRGFDDSVALHLSRKYPR